MEPCPPKGPGGERAGRGPWEPPLVVEEHRLLHVIGRGGMGLGYLGHDQVLDRAVAVKFVAAEPDDHARQRLLVEARAAARPQHPNLVSIYRVGEVDSRSSARSWCAARA